MSPVRRPRFRADRDPVWDWQPPAQVGTTGSELELSAAQVRAFQRALAAAHQPWADAMQIPCRVHNKAIGRYCWYTRGGAVRGVCMERVRRALAKRTKQQASHAAA